VEQKKVNYFLFFFSQVRRGLVQKFTGVFFSSLTSCVSGQNFTGVFFNQFNQLCLQLKLYRGNTLIPGQLVIPGAAGATGNTGQ
jgi:hypothetical protein